MFTVPDKRNDEATSSTALIPKLTLTSLRLCLSFSNRKTHYNYLEYPRTLQFRLIRLKLDVKQVSHVLKLSTDKDPHEIQFPLIDIEELMLLIVVCMISPCIKLSGPVVVSLDYATKNWHLNSTHAIKCTEVCIQYQGQASSDGSESFIL